MDLALNLLGNVASTLTPLFLEVKQSPCDPVSKSPTLPEICLGNAQVHETAAGGWFSENGYGGRNRMRRSESDPTEAIFRVHIFTGTAAATIIVPTHLGCRLWARR